MVSADDTPHAMRRWQTMRLLPAVSVTLSDVPVSLRGTLSVHSPSRPLTTMDATAGATLSLHVAVAIDSDDAAVLGGSAAVQLQAGVALVGASARLSLATGASEPPAPRGADQGPLACLLQLSGNKTAAEVTCSARAGEQEDAQPALDVRVRSTFLAEGPLAFCMIASPQHLQQLVLALACLRPAARVAAAPAVGIGAGLDSGVQQEAPQLPSVVVRLSTVPEFTVSDAGAVVRVGRWGSALRLGFLHALPAFPRAAPRQASSRSAQSQALKFTGRSPQDADALLAPEAWQLVFSACSRGQAAAALRPERPRPSVPRKLAGIFQCASLEVDANHAGIWLTFLRDDDSVCDPQPRYNADSMRSLVTVATAALPSMGEALPAHLLARCPGLLGCSPTTSSSLPGVLGDRVCWTQVAALGSSYVRLRLPDLGACAALLQVACSVRLASPRLHLQLLWLQAVAPHILQCLAACQPLAVPPITTSGSEERPLLPVEPPRSHSPVAHRTEPRAEGAPQQRLKWRAEVHRPVLLLQSLPLSSHITLEPPSVARPCTVHAAQTAAGPDSSAPAAAGSREAVPAAPSTLPLRIATASIQLSRLEVTNRRSTSGSTHVAGDSSERASTGLLRMRSGPMSVALRVQHAEATLAQGRPEGSSPAIPAAGNTAGTQLLFVSRAVVTAHHAAAATVSSPDQCASTAVSCDLGQVHADWSLAGHLTVVQLLLHTRALAKALRHPVHLNAGARDPSHAAPAALPTLSQPRIHPTGVAVALSAFGLAITSRLSDRSVVSWCWGHTEVSGELGRATADPSAPGEPATLLVGRAQSQGFAMYIHGFPDPVLTLRSCGLSLQHHSARTPDAPPASQGDVGAAAESAALKRTAVALKYAGLHLFLHRQAVLGDVIADLRDAQKYARKASAALARSAAAAAPHPAVPTDTEVLAPPHGSALSAPAELDHAARAPTPPIVNIDFSLAVDGGVLEWQEIDGARLAVQQALWSGLEPGLRQRKDDALALMQSVSGSESLHSNAVTTALSGMEPPALGLLHCSSFEIRTRYSSVEHSPTELQQFIATSDSCAATAMPTGQASTNVVGGVGDAPAAYSHAGCACCNPLEHGLRDAHGCEAQLTMRGLAFGVRAGRVRAYGAESGPLVSEQAWATMMTALRTPQCVAAACTVALKRDMLSPLASRSPLATSSFATGAGNGGAISREASDRASSVTTPIDMVLMQLSDALSTLPTRAAVFLPRPMLLADQLQLAGPIVIADLLPPAEDVLPATTLVSLPAEPAVPHYAVPLRFCRVLQASLPRDAAQPAALFCIAGHRGPSPTKTYHNLTLDLKGLRVHMGPAREADLLAFTTAFARMVPTTAAHPYTDTILRPQDCVWPTQQLAPVLQQLLSPDAPPAMAVSATDSNAVVGIAGERAGAAARTAAHSLPAVQPPGGLCVTCFLPSAARLPAPQPALSRKPANASSAGGADGTSGQPPKPPPLKWWDRLRFFVHGQMRLRMSDAVIEFTAPVPAVLGRGTGHQGGPSSALGIGPGGEGIAYVPDHDSRAGFCLAMDSGDLLFARTGRFELQLVGATVGLVSASEPPIWGEAPSMLQRLASLRPAYGAPHPYPLLSLPALAGCFSFQWETRGSRLWQAESRGRGSELPLQAGCSPDQHHLQLAAARAALRRVPGDGEAADPFAAFRSLAVHAHATLRAGASACALQYVVPGLTGLQGESPAAEAQRRDASAAAPACGRAELAASQAAVALAALSSLAPPHQGAADDGDDAASAWGSEAGDEASEAPLATSTSGPHPTPRGTATGEGSAAGDGEHTEPPLHGGYQALMSPTATTRPQASQRAEEAESSAAMPNPPPDDGTVDASAPMHARTHPEASAAAFRAASRVPLAVPVLALEWSSFPSLLRIYSALSDHFPHPPCTYSELGYDKVMPQAADAPRSLPAALGSLLLDVAVDLPEHPSIADPAAYFDAGAALMLPSRGRHAWLPSSGERPTPGLIPPPADSASHQHAVTVALWSHAAPATRGLMLRARRLHVSWLVQRRTAVPVLPSLARMPHGLCLTVAGAEISMPPLLTASQQAARQMAHCGAAAAALRAAGSRACYTLPRCNVLPAASAGNAPTGDNGRAGSDGAPSSLRRVHSFADMTRPAQAQGAGPQASSSLLHTRTSGVLQSSHPLHHHQLSIGQSLRAIGASIHHSHHIHASVAAAGASGQADGATLPVARASARWGRRVADSSSGADEGRHRPSSAEPAHRPGPPLLAVPEPASDPNGTAESAALPLPLSCAGPRFTFSPHPLALLHAAKAVIAAPLLAYGTGEAGAALSRRRTAAVQRPAFPKGEARGTLAAAASQPSGAAAADFPTRTQPVAAAAAPVPVFDFSLASAARAPSGAAAPPQGPLEPEAAGSQAADARVQVARSDSGGTRASAADIFHPLGVHEQGQLALLHEACCAEAAYSGCRPQAAGHFGASAGALSGTQRAESDDVVTGAEDDHVEAALDPLTCLYTWPHVTAASSGGAAATTRNAVLRGPTVELWCPRIVYSLRTRDALVGWIDSLQDALDRRAAVSWRPFHSQLAQDHQSAAATAAPLPSKQHAADSPFEGSPAPRAGGVPVAGAAAPLRVSASPAQPDAVRHRAAVLTCHSVSAALPSLLADAVAGLHPTLEVAAAGQGSSLEGTPLMAMHALAEGSQVRDTLLATLTALASEQRAHALYAGAARLLAIPMPSMPPPSVYPSRTLPRLRAFLAGLGAAKDERRPVAGAPSERQPAAELPGGVLASDCVVVPTLRLALMQPQMAILDTAEGIAVVLAGGSASFLTGKPPQVQAARNTCGSSPAPAAGMAGTHSPRRGPASSPAIGPPGPGGLSLRRRFHLGFYGISGFLDRRTLGPEDCLHWPLQPSVIHGTTAAVFLARLQLLRRYLRLSESIAPLEHGRLADLASRLAQLEKAVLLLQSASLLAATGSSPGLPQCSSRVTGTLQPVVLEAEVHWLNTLHHLPAAASTPTSLPPGGNGANAAAECPPHELAANTFALPRLHAATGPKQLLRFVTALRRVLLVGPKDDPVASVLRQTVGRRVLLPEQWHAAWRSCVPSATGRLRIAPVPWFLVAAAPNPPASAAACIAAEPLPRPQPSVHLDSSSADPGVLALASWAAPNAGVLTQEGEGEVQEIRESSDRFAQVAARGSRQEAMAVALESALQSARGRAPDARGFGALFPRVLQLACGAMDASTSAIEAPQRRALAAALIAAARLIDQQAAALAQATAATSADVERPQALQSRERHLGVEAARAANGRGAAAATPLPKPQRLQLRKGEEKLLRLRLQERVEALMALAAGTASGLASATGRTQIALSAGAGSTPSAAVSLAPSASVEGDVGAELSLVPSTAAGREVATPSSVDHAAAAPKPGTAPQRSRLSRLLRSRRSVVDGGPAEEALHPLEAAARSQSSRLQEEPRGLLSPAVQQSLSAASLRGTSAAPGRQVLGAGHGPAALGTAGHLAHPSLRRLALTHGLHFAAAPASLPSSSPAPASPAAEALSHAATTARVTFETPSRPVRDGPSAGATPLLALYRRPDGGIEVVMPAAEPGTDQLVPTPAAQLRSWARPPRSADGASDSEGDQAGSKPPTPETTALSPLRVSQAARPDSGNRRFVFPGLLSPSPQRDRDSSAAQGFQPGSSAKQPGASPALGHTEAVSPRTVAGEPPAASSLYVCLLLLLEMHPLEQWLAALPPHGPQPALAPESTSLQAAPWWGLQIAPAPAAQAHRGLTGPIGTTPLSPSAGLLYTPAAKRRRVRSLEYGIASLTLDLCSHHANTQLPLAPLSRAGTLTSPLALQATSGLLLRSGQLDLRRRRRVLRAHFAGFRGAKTEFTDGSSVAEYSLGCALISPIARAFGGEAAEEETARQLFAAAAVGVPAPITPLVFASGDAGSDSDTSAAEAGEVGSSAEGASQPILAVGVVGRAMGPRDRFLQITAVAKAKVQPCAAGALLDASAVHPERAGDRQSSGNAVMPLPGETAPTPRETTSGLRSASGEPGSFQTPPSTETVRAPQPAAGGFASSLLAGINSLADSVHPASLADMAVPVYDHVEISLFPGAEHLVEVSLSKAQATFLAGFLRRSKRAKPAAGAELRGNTAGALSETELQDEEGDSEPGSSARAESSSRRQKDSGGGTSRRTQQSEPQVRSAAHQLNAAAEHPVQEDAAAEAVLAKSGAAAVGSEELLALARGTSLRQRAVQAARRLGARVRTQATAELEPAGARPDAAAVAQSQEPHAGEAPEGRGRRLLENARAMLRRKARRYGSSDDEAGQRHGSLSPGHAAALHSAGVGPGSPHSEAAGSDLEASSAEGEGHWRGQPHREEATSRMKALGGKLIPARLKRRWTARRERQRLRELVQVEREQQLQRQRGQLAADGDGPSALQGAAGRPGLLARLRRPYGGTRAAGVRTVEGVDGAMVALPSPSSSSSSSSTPSSASEDESADSAAAGDTVAPSPRVTLPAANANPPGEQVATVASAAGTAATPVVPFTDMPQRSSRRLSAAQGRPDAAVLQRRSVRSLRSAGLMPQWVAEAAVDPYAADGVPAASLSVRRSTRGLPSFQESPRGPPVASYEGATADSQHADTAAYSGTLAEAAGSAFGAGAQRAGAEEAEDDIGDSASVVAAAEAAAAAAPAADFASGAAGPWTAAAPTALPPVPALDRLHQRHASAMLLGLPSPSRALSGPAGAGGRSRASSRLPGGLFGAAAAGAAEAAAPGRRGSWATEDGFATPNHQHTLATISDAFRATASATLNKLSLGLLSRPGMAALPEELRDAGGEPAPEGLAAAVAASRGGARKASERPRLAGAFAGLAAAGAQGTGVAAAPAAASAAAPSAQLTPRQRGGTSWNPFDSPASRPTAAAPAVDAVPVQMPTGPAAADVPAQLLRGWGSTAARGVASDAAAPSGGALPAPAVGLATTAPPSSSSFPLVLPPMLLSPSTAVSTWGQLQQPPQPPQPPAAERCAHLMQPFTRSSAAPTRCAACGALNVCQRAVSELTFFLASGAVISAESCSNDRRPCRGSSHNPGIASSAPAAGAPP